MCQSGYYLKYTKLQVCSSVQYAGNHSEDLRKKRDGVKSWSGILSPVPCPASRQLWHLTAFNLMLEVWPGAVRRVKSAVLSHFSHVRLFATSWQAPLSMGFSRQEFWRGLTFLSPGYLPNPGNPESLGRFSRESPSLKGENPNLQHWQAGGSLPPAPPGKQ